jgi:putative Ca2+/H+ antiporter (TMEM165/GDT1 family)
MEIIFKSFLLVTATEMGDKTQLLAFMLATRFKKPWPILAGILAATLLNHLLAASLGQLIAHAINPVYLKWILGIVFIAFGAWVLIPDKGEDGKTEERFGPFLTTLITFFLAEMGDKTQLSTVALAAQFHSTFLVTVGSTLGMIAADGPAVFFGDKMAEKIPMKWVRAFACFLFIAFGAGIMFL